MHTHPMHTDTNFISITVIDNIKAIQRMFGIIYMIEGVEGGATQRVPIFSLELATSSPLLASIIPMDQFIDDIHHKLYYRVLILPLQ